MLVARGGPCDFQPSTLKSATGVPSVLGVSLNQPPARPRPTLPVIVPTRLRPLGAGPSRSLRTAGFPLRARMFCHGFPLPDSPPS